MSTTRCLMIRLHLMCYFLGLASLISGQVEGIVAIPEIVHTNEYPELAGLTTYRYYLQTDGSDVFVKRLFGSDSHPFLIDGTTVYNAGDQVMNGGERSCISIDGNPPLAVDAWLTIGTPHDCFYSVVPQAQFISPSIASIEGSLAGDIGTLALTDFNLEVLDNHPSGIPVDNLVLIGQFTSDDPPLLTAQVDYYLDGDLDVLFTANDLTTTFLEVGCMDVLANNFNPAATLDDGSCTFGPLIGVFWEEVDIPEFPENYPEGASTFRIYAQMSSPLDQVTAVYATDNCHDLMLTSTTDSCWNDFQSAITGDQLNPAFFSEVPEGEWDSFVTIGRANSDSAGGPIQAFSLQPDEFVFQESFQDSGWNPGVFLLDGIWFSFPDEVNNFGQGPENTVLLAQMTTDGIPEYALNLQIIDEADEEHRYTHSPSGPGDCVASKSGAGYHLSNLTQTACLDPLACNYEAEAIYAQSDPDLCEYSSCLGCTNPDATNFDPFAIIDDASCFVPCLVNIVELDWFCEYDGGLETVLYSLEINAMLSSSCNLDSICLVDPALNANCMNLEDIGLNWQDGVSMVVPFTISSPGTIQDIVVPGSDLVSGITSVEVNECIAGCTDELAANYNPDASLEDGSCIFDDCFENEFFIRVVTGSWAGFIALQLEDEEGNLLFSNFNYENDEIKTDSVCVVNGCYKLFMIDERVSTSWEESYYEIEYEDQVIQTGSGTSTYSSFDYISINANCPNAGCTDDTALNFDSTATEDDGSCVGGTENPSGFGEDPPGDELTNDAVHTWGSNEVNVTIGGGQAGELYDIVLFDSAAREVMRSAFFFDGDFPTLSVDISQISPGFYVLAIIQGDQISTFSFVKFAY